jgi:hypothetical protein
VVKHLRVILLVLLAVLQMGGATAPGPMAPMTPAVHPDSACSSCHTDPHGDATTPRACEDCHTAEGWRPSTFTVAQHAKTAMPLHDKHADVSCNQCHTKGRLAGLPTECSGCHIGPHRGKLGGECETCHSAAGFTPVDGFDHALTGFVVDGSHAGQECAACHKGPHGDAMRLVETASCETCHTEAHAQFEGTCTDCHETAHKTFAAGVFDHRGTGFSLERRHKLPACAECHPVGAEHAPSDRCSECHVDPHAQQLGTRCESCHQPHRWSLVKFDHDQTGWPLRGRHFVTACGDCHTAQRWVGLQKACWDCHAQDAAAAPASVDAHRWVRSTCNDCHGTWTWK